MKARTLRTFSQLQLAADTTNTGPQILMVEDGPANLSPPTRRLPPRPSAPGSTSSADSPLTPRWIASSQRSWPTQPPGSGTSRSSTRTSPPPPATMSASPELAGPARGRAGIDWIAGRVKFRRERIARHAPPRKTAASSRCSANPRGPRSSTAVRSSSTKPAGRDVSASSYVVRTDDGLGRQAGRPGHPVRHNLNTPAWPTPPSLTTPRRSAKSSGRRPQFRKE